MPDLRYLQSSPFAIPVFRVPAGAYRANPALPVATVHARTPFRFGLYTVDAARHTVAADGRELHLEPRSFALLSYLIERRDRVVSKGELLDALWPSIHVCESVVARSVMKIRAALGDPGRSSSMIRTVHRIGYRFVAPVEADG